MRVSHQQLISALPGRGPLYLDIYHRLRRLISEGAWPRGTRLPSSRNIARDLGVSRNTALMAIEKLIADGWVVPRRGSGIYVSDETPSREVSDFAAAASKEDRQACLAVPFELSHPAVDIFPVAAWNRIQSKVWQNWPLEALHEGSDAGWLPLRREFASHLHAVRGLRCRPDQVIIVSSTQAAIDLTLCVLSQPGDRIWVEDPGYPKSRDIFRLHRLSQHPVPVDIEGLNVSAGRTVAEEAKFAHVTPACQFPLCSALSPSRRAELLAWARERRSYVIEDDWDFNAVFDGPMVEPLAAQDPERVIFIHALNRVMFPALRIAALVVPTELVDRFLAARRVIDGLPNVANQIALAEFMRFGFLSAHIRHSRTVHHHRGELLSQLLSDNVGSLLEIAPVCRGLHLLARAPAGHSAELARAIRSRGIRCLATSEFSSRAMDDQDSLMLGFAAFPQVVLQEATRRLGGALRELRPTML